MDSQLSEGTGVTQAGTARHHGSAETFKAEPGKQARQEDRAKGRIF